MEQRLFRQLSEIERYFRGDNDPEADPANGEYELDEAIAFLIRYGFDRRVLTNASQRAVRLGLPAEQVLILSGAISDTDYYRYFALELDIPFVEHPPVNDDIIELVPDPSQLARMARIVRSENTIVADNSGSLERALHLAPDGRELASLKKRVLGNREFRMRSRITTRQANLTNLIQRSSKALLNKAIHGLSTAFPQRSARLVISPRQAVILLLVVQMLAMIAYRSHGHVLLALHLVASALYLGCIGLRLLSIPGLKRRWSAGFSRLIPGNMLAEGQLPTYSILVAVYQEVSQIDDLVAALAQLRWPPERLEVKLVCEADDAATMTACRSAIGRLGLASFTVIVVPPSRPRTKPRALSYALPLCTGEYVVVYDAEDRPHPLQLREAHAAFRTGSPMLACLQAPLVIHNYQDGWLAQFMAIEYSVQFDALVPMLAHFGLPVPLGGTSNHFRRSVLIEVGGWDPYNVTEDVDLGLRLAREGWQVGTITSPTYEEAPSSFAVWCKQRTRWFKGWYQTLLVHTRQPVQLLDELGPAGMLAFILLMPGLAISCLVHPLLLYHVIVRLAEPVLSGSFGQQSYLFWLDLTTILLGYLTLALIALYTLPLRGLQTLRGVLWRLPLYWMLLSIAAWRALWQLIYKPHHWEKTPHLKTRTDSPPLPWQ